MIDAALPREELRAYVGGYLQEEIRGEGLTRAIEPFSRFLTVAGVGNGELLNFTAIGSDAEVPGRTVREYWRSRSGFEVDFVIGDHTAIEVKAAGRISDRDLRGLRALSEDVTLANKIVVSSEAQERRTDDGVRILPIETFLRRLWRDELSLPQAF